MALVPTQLADALEAQWLPREEGPFPDSAQASADALAGAVAGWFAGATAGPFPCLTAAVRRDQLAALLAPALSAGAAPAAGQQIAVAFMAYVAGQSFGSGVAAPPVATPAAGSMIGAALAQAGTPRAARAAQIAGALQLMAVSTMVAFPQPPFAAPVT